MNLMIFLILIPLTISWQMIESAFYGQPMQNTTNWYATSATKTYSGSGDDRRFLDESHYKYQKQSPSVEKCLNNPQQFIGLNETIMRVNKTFTAAHYKILLVANFFYFNKCKQYHFKFKISTGSDKFFEHDYDQNDFQTQSKICSKQSSDIYYQYSTLVQSKTHSDYNFTIDFRYDTDDGNNQVGINNVFIYTLPCHYSCQECSGPNDNQCTDCYSEKVTGGKCACEDGNFLLKNFGCILECPNNYLADSTFYCQDNPAVQSLSSSFTSNNPTSSDWLNYMDLSDKPLLECQKNRNKYQIVGPFSGIEGFSYSFQSSNSRIAIRLRITITFFSFSQNSELLIFFDDILQSQITKTSSGYTISQGTLIFDYNTTCNNQKGYVARYETILNSYNNTPVLKVFGTYLTSSEQWGFQNVTIDSIFCGLYCESCYDDNSCLTCISGYYLHKHNCVKTCPPYSTLNSLICEDYADDDVANNYGTYLVKAFYDFNTSVDDLSNIIDIPTWSSVTGQYFSFYPDKIILGGPLIWENGNSFKKVFTNLKAHGQIKLMFKAIIGDQFSGGFSYQIDGGTVQTVTVASEGTNNYVGNNYIDYRKSVSVTQAHTSNTLTIEFNCQITSTEGFCGISDYYIILYASSTCISSQYYNGSVCTNCPGQCTTCESATQCKTCKDPSAILVRGQCICKPPKIKESDTGNCVPCDSSCQTCFGISDTQCITCSSSRKLSNHKCVCGDGYYGDNAGQCKSICGDGVKVSEEQCDDGNNIDFDGCSSLCLLECQKQCTLCNDGVCSACNTEHWQLIPALHVCQPICGDGYVVEGIEECDNGNDPNQTGCTNCFYTCQDVCTSCKEGLCYDCNTMGWILDNNTCIPNCGDGLVIGYEQCDDMNDIQYDGCYQCKFQCDNLCTNCNDGICYECQIGRYVIDNQCITECGDGIFVEQIEQCDDGNRENLDGCNQNCQIEQNWQCDLIGSISQCYNIIKPEFNIQILTPNPTNEQQLLISFTLPIQSTVEIKDINSYMSFSIEGFSDNYYHTEYQFNESNISIPQNLGINLNISFLLPCEYPTLTVAFDKKLFVSEYGIQLLQNMKSKNLKTPMMLSDQQKLVAETTEKFNSAIIYSLLGVAAFCLLTGSLDIFWNLMDQLQYISYLKYANVVFPENLNIFFNSFNMISLDPILRITGLDTLINALDGPDDYVINPPEKFLNDGVNAYFLSNFSSSIFCILTAYLSLGAAKICIKLYYRYLEEVALKIGFRLTKLFILCHKLSLILIKSFYYNGLLRLLMANCYDCSFSAYIQINNYQSNGDIFTNINYFMAVTVAFGQAGLTMMFMNIAHSFQSNKTIKKQKNFDSIFDGVKQKKDFWVIQYNSVYLIKKQIFIFLIVFFYQSGAIQTLAIGINQLAFAFYMIINKPLENKYEYYKTVVTESLIVFISTTFVIYPLREGLGLSLDSYIILGWIHIGAFCSILGFSLIVDGIQQLQELKGKFFQKKEVESSNQVMFY